jgi:hypothetical protein
LGLLRKGRVDHASLLYIVAPAQFWAITVSAGRSLKCPVGGSKAAPPVLSPKDTQFVTEHDDLEILGGLALAIWDQQPEQHPNHQVHER